MATVMTNAKETATKETLRQYKRLPVWIVEDHNDALQHIYRAIASHYLPFSGATMLHFDSHPDLQINTDMDADVVFDKDELISSLSIENWIMPAMYAGHIDHVIWVKPPWADQLADGTKHVHIGKHRDTGKLRVSWPDVYFLSDILYAPVDKLDNAKSVTIDTVTMETDILKVTSCDIDNQLAASSKLCVDESCGINAKRTKTEEDDVISSGTSESIDPKLDGKTKVEDTEHAAKDKTTKGRESNEVKSHQEVTGHLEVLAKAVSNSFILDIDLDFFSTKNPFKEVYTKEQYVLLEELYSFTLPVDNSEKAIEYCQIQREIQLEELQEALTAAWDGTKPKIGVNEKRFNKVKSLVTSLRTHPPENDTLDAELIHMAGLTCDDTGELPHHISTQEQITSLIDAMKILLTSLPQPTLVTVARSSHDDYCPPKQVEGIQSQVLQTLESIYGSLDVHKDYEKQEIGH